jgi:uncharacterized protein (DUF433 family)
MALMFEQAYDEDKEHPMANLDAQKFDAAGFATTGLDEEEQIDWMACELIESVPGKVSGRPVVKGTRIMPDAIVGSYELGETIEVLREGFPSLSESQIRRLIEFADAQRGHMHP